MLYAETHAEAARLIVEIAAAHGVRKRRLRVLPVGAGWTISRDFPAPSGKTFRTLYRAHVVRHQRITRV